MSKVAGAAAIAMYGRGLSTVFNKYYDLAGSHPGFGLMRVVHDSADKVDYPIPDGLPSPREWDGDRAEKAHKLGVLSVLSKAYEATLGVPGHHVRLGRGEQYGPEVQMMASRARLHPLKMLGDLLNNAFGTTKSYDGVALCADAHSWGGQTIDNKQTAALAGDAFADARAALFSLKDSEGEYIWTGMERLALVVSPDLEDDAEQIVVAATGSSGATNVRKGKADVVVLPHLHDNPGYWFLIVKDLPPFVHQIQEKIVFESQTKPDSDNVWNRDKYVYGVRGRYAVGVGPYWSIVGSDGTT